MIAEGGMATLLANPVKMIERGAPRVIRTEKELEAYTRALFGLTAQPRPTKAQVDAIDLLTLLIERYESEHYSLPDATAADVLRFLLDRHSLKQRDIARELGGESVVSEVLSGKRKLNTTQIERLSKRFHVSQAVFFPSTE
jgi:HTH-type transcriptional regulator / antitoxin HigA